MEQLSPKANPDEAAAIAAAVERFRAETARVEAAAGETVSPWQRAALVEGSARRAPFRSI